MNVVPESGSLLNIEAVFPGMGISMIKIRRSSDRLIFTMGIPTVARLFLYTETIPEYQGQGEVITVFVGCDYSSLPLIPASSSVITVRGPTRQ